MPTDVAVRKVSEKGWVVIPQDLREKYRLHRGTGVRFVDYGGVLAIVPDLEDPIKHGFGMLKGRRLTQRLLDEHKQDRESQ